MNYYEELGIRQDAAIEEIRQAYKLLARLLHPDGQPDARLKALAECQMKRLNEILATLTDSQKRRRYDESLYETPKAALEYVPQPIQPAYWYRVLHFGLQHWFGVLIALVALGVGAWYIGQRAPEATRIAPRLDAPPAVAQSQSGPPLHLSATAVPQVPQRAVPAPRVAPQTAPHKAADASRVSAELKLPEPPPALPANASPSVNEIPLPSLIPAAEPPRLAPGTTQTQAQPASPVSITKEASFAGSWLYHPESSAKADPNLYPATYVELTLSEEQGNLVGDYRAKYRVPGQGISPDVQFRVRGKSANGKSCKLTWASDDGAQGEAEFTLRSSNQMNVTWWTTVFGRRAALSSGMAVLVRQQAP
jgi:hypothetical protein